METRSMPVEPAIRTKQLNWSQWHWTEKDALNHKTPSKVIKQGKKKEGHRSTERHPPCDQHWFYTMPQIPEEIAAPLN